MASCSGLLRDLLDLLNIHRPISGRWHLNKMSEQPGYIKTRDARLCHRAYLELGYFFPRSLIAVLLCNARTIWAFRFLERFFA